MAETGVRTGAMLSREWEHLRRVPDEHDDVARICVMLLSGDTKGKRARIPPLLSTELSIEVDAYRTELQIEGRCTEYAFRPWQEQRQGMWRQMGDSESAKRLRRLLRDVCRDLGEPEITPHGFRRVVATTLEELNVATEAIQETVGWRDKDVIERHYLGRGVPEQRAVQQAREVADVRAFGTTIAKVRAER
jgi:integrase